MARNPFYELLKVGERVVVRGDTFTEEVGKRDREGVITSVDKGSIRREYCYHVLVQGINDGKPFAVSVMDAIRPDEKFGRSGLELIEKR